MTRKEFEDEFMLVMAKAMKAELFEDFVLVMRSSEHVAGTMASSTDRLTVGKFLIRMGVANLIRAGESDAPDRTVVLNVDTGETSDLIWKDSDGESH